jgi:prepilin-type N-terminal cleavage/methylation domain-containing protein
MNKCVQKRISTYQQARPATRRAFTLVEALMASTILAVVAASASLPFIAVAQQTNAAGEYETAAELGEELMEEILARPMYAPGERTPSPGPESDETERKYFNAVDDFHNYSEYRADTTKYMSDYKGSSVSASQMDGYWRQSKVEYVRMPNQSSSDSNYAFARITVEVFRDNRSLLKLVRLKARED